MERLLVDAMLGRLAAWLRILGIDTYYQKELTDQEIIKKAQTTKRIVITRDRTLYQKLKKLNVKTILLKTDKTQQQLVIVYQLLFPSQTISPVGTRCSLCNEILKPITRNHLEKIKHTVKPELHLKTLETYDEFWMCSNCKHVYWKGKMWRNIQQTLTNMNKTADKYNSSFYESNIKNF